MMKGVEKQIQPRIIITLEKIFFLGVTGTSVTTAQSLQLPKNPAVGFDHPCTYIHCYILLA